MNLKAVKFYVEFCNFLAYNYESVWMSLEELKESVGV